MKKMRSIIVALVLASLVLSACASATPAPATEAPTAAPAAVEPTAEPMEEEAMDEMALPDLGGRVVSVAIENAYPPFNYIDEETGEGAGWDYDTWNAVCELLNCVPDFKEAAWEGMIQAVADGQFDSAGDGITITPERAEIVDFSHGYVTVEQRLMVRIDEDRISSIDDIVNDESLVLGTQTGTTNYEVAQQFLPMERIQAFEQFPFAVQALIAGDVDAVMIDDQAGQGYTGENSELLKLVGPSLSSDLLAFIYPKGSDLVEPVDQALLALMADGTLDSINEKYDFYCDYSDPDNIFCGQ